MADAPGHHQHQHQHHEQHQDLTLQAPADPDDSAVAILSSSSKLQTENKIRKPSYGGSFFSAVQLKQYLPVGWEKIQEMQVFNKQQNQRLGRSRVLAIAAAIFAFLMLVVVLAYQISSGSVSIWPDGADLNDYFHWQTHKKPLNLTFLAGPTFNCSDLGLKGTKRVVEAEDHYHVFRAGSGSDGERCGSKYEQHCYRANAGRKHRPEAEFVAALREYEEYHARCTAMPGPELTRMAEAGDVAGDGDGDGCKYLVWKSMDGMGNQLLSLVCAFTYAMLTRRAMLVATDSHIEHHLCNPFPRSSWLLPDGFPEPRLRAGAKRLFEYVSEAAANNGHNNNNNDNGSSSPGCDSSTTTRMPRPPTTPKHLLVYIVCCDERRDHPFFCPGAQRLIAPVPWLFYHSHEYTLPALYFVPGFRERLHRWFPRHDAFMHVGRYLLNPVDRLWAGIAAVYREQLDGVPRTVGFQARSWRGDYKPEISRQIVRCGVEQKLLPRAGQAAMANGTRNGRNEKDDGRPDISVMVASLRAEYRDDVRAEYEQRPNDGGLTVKVWTASHEGAQRTGDRGHDETAIADIWLLSFMRELVTTPFSTFGSTASGLAGIVPLLFEAYGEDRTSQPACSRTNAAGPCFIVFPRNQPCDLDPPRSSIFDPSDMLPEIKFCSFNPGLGIVSLPPPPSSDDHHHDD